MYIIALLSTKRASGYINIYLFSYYNLESIDVTISFPQETVKSSLSLHM